MERVPTTRLAVWICLQTDVTFWCHWRFKGEVGGGGLPGAIAILPCLAPLKINAIQQVVLIQQRQHNTSTRSRSVRVSLCERYEANTQCDGLRHMRRMPRKSFVRGGSYAWLAWMLRNVPLLRS